MKHDSTHIIRCDLLAVVGAVGSIRDRSEQLSKNDAEYFDRELSKMQAAAHRLLEFLDNIDQRH